MRLVVDIQSLQSPASAHRGVGRYTANLLRALIECKDEHEVLVAANSVFPDSISRLRAEFSPLIGEENFVVWHQLFSTASSDAGADLRRAAQILRERFFDSLVPDFVFCPNLQEGLHDDACTGVRSSFVQYKYCSTLHDLVPLQYPHYLDDLKTRVWYGEKMSAAAASDVLLTVSQTSKFQIAKRLRLSATDIHVISNGVDENIFDKSISDSSALEEARSFYALPSEFLLYFGGVDEHKNLERLIAAFSQLDNDSLFLVLIGRDVLTSASLSACISRCRARGRIIRLGALTDSELVKIIKMALALVMPSRFEGFGLPALEAMACGAAVIGGRGTSVGEVIDFPDALFDPTDIDDMSKVMTNVVTNPLFRKQLASHGYERSKEFRWNKSARKMWSILQQKLVDTPYFLSEDKASFTGWADDSKELSRFLDEVRPLTKSLSSADNMKIAISAVETFSSRAEKKVFLDISTIVVLDHRSGIQRVVRSIAVALQRSKWNGKRVQLVYGLVDGLGFLEADDFFVSGTLRRPAVEAKFCHGDTLVYLDLNPGLAISRRRFNDHLRLKGVTVVFVVYDLLPMLKPKMFWPELCEEFMAWIDEVGRADAALCISKAVATELVAYISRYGPRRQQPLRVEWFHLGSDIQNSKPTVGRPLNGDFILAQIKSKPTFLMVGTLEPRKGHMQTLHACERLWAEGLNFNLVIVGREGWGVSELVNVLVRHPEKKTRLYWLSSISDLFLEEIYRSSTCLIAASIAEGFGLPLIEASERGLPLLIRDIPVFREVAGLNATYFPNTHSVGDLANAIKDWLTNAERQNVVGSQQLFRKSWEESASEFVRVLTKAEWFATVHGGASLRVGRSETPHSDNLICRNIGLSGEVLGGNAQIDFSSMEETNSSLIRFEFSALVSGSVHLQVNGNQAFAENLWKGRTTVIIEAMNKKYLETVVSWIDGHSPGALIIEEIAIEDIKTSLVANKVETFASDKISWFGFSLPEADFRWSLGHRSWICFKFDALSSPANMCLRMKFSTLGRQRVIVSGRYVEDIESVFDGLHTVEVGLVEGPHSIYIIQISLPDAAAPSLQDQRELGIALRSVELVVSDDTE